MLDASWRQCGVQMRDDRRFTAEDARARYLAEQTAELLQRLDAIEERLEFLSVAISRQLRPH